jgi:hypothetical protein
MQDPSYFRRIGDLLHVHRHVHKSGQRICELGTATVCGLRGQVDSQNWNDDHLWTWIRRLTFETLKTVMSQDSPVLSRS